MRIQAFIPDWPGPKQHAKETESLIAPFCESTCILGDPNDFFTQQWEKARAAFTGDVLLWIMADVWPPSEVEEMFKSIQLYLEPTSHVGIYAPNVEWTGQELFRNKLIQIATNVYKVPMPEMLCWALRKEVLDVMPHVDPGVNKYGWGIDYLATAAAEKVGLIAARDYNLCASHPNSTSYGNNQAAVQYQNWLNSLDTEWRQRVDGLFAERQRVGVRLRNLIIYEESSINVAEIVRRDIIGADTDTVRMFQVPAMEDDIETTMKNVNDLYIFTKDYPLELIWMAAQTGFIDNIWIPISQARQGNYPFGDMTIHGVQCGLILARNVKQMIDKQANI